MELSRYQFEIMAFLQENQNKPFVLRTISDKICVSASLVSQQLTHLTELNLVDLSDDIIKVTDQGYNLLEQYRVKKAIILAAGFGSRMLPATLDRPKPLVSVNKVRIIDTLLDALLASEVEDIYIVTGYKADKFSEILAKYPQVKLVNNPIYDQTNNISSVMAILNQLDNCYLCEADLYISNPRIIKKYQYCSNILGSYSLQTDDWSFTMKDGYIDNYQKGNNYCYNYYGISFWNHTDCIKLREDFVEVYQNGGQDYFWEFVPLVLKKDKYNVEIRQCQKEDIMEIDNYYELQQLDSSYR
ncbi:MAG: NTP transferase domain-containing protein [Erysipelotrichaceae bacterium]